MNRHRCRLSKFNTSRESNTRFFLVGSTKVKAHKYFLLIENEEHLVDFIVTFILLSLFFNALYSSRLSQLTFALKIWDFVNLSSSHLNRSHGVMDKAVASPSSFYCILTDPGLIPPHSLPLISFSNYCLMIRFDCETRSFFVSLRENGFPPLFHLLLNDQARSRGEGGGGGVNRVRPQSSIKQYIVLMWNWMYGRSGVLWYSTVILVHICCIPVIRCY